MFTGINKKNPIQPSNPINVHAMIGKIVLGLIIIIIAGYFLINLVNVASKVSTNWQELQFAYNKPAIVKAVRVQYANKASAVEAQFLNEAPTIASEAATPTLTETPTPTAKQAYHTPLK